MNMRRFMDCLIGLGVAVGCAAEIPAVDEGPPLHPVSGILKIGGKPASGAMIKFVPSRPPPGLVAGGKPSDRTPTAIVGADGRYTATTRHDGDGALEGSYKLLVVWMEEPPEGGLPRDRLRGKYFDDARPAAVVEVKPGANSLSPIDLRP